MRPKQKLLDATEPKAKETDNHRKKNVERADSGKCGR
jgi:hypothetical protein